MVITMQDDKYPVTCLLYTSVKSLCGNGYNVSAWVDAVVPGTAFNSYVIAGLEKDPNFGEMCIRDRYCIA